LEILFSYKSLSHYMIVLVGTGHVFDLSSKIVQLIEEKSPNLVCVELDEKRYGAIISPDKDSRNIPIMYRILSKFQQRVAEWYGTRVGEEMITAIEVAKRKGIDVEFIDMDAEEIFRKFWKNMSLREKLKIIFSGIFGLVGRRSTIEREINKFKDRVDEVIEEIGRNFPSIKKVLIDERNEHMARRLEELSKEYDRIIAFIGDGHVPGIEKHLRSRNIEVEVVRLRDLQDNTNISFTVEVDP